MALFGNLSAVSSQLASPDHFSAAFRYAARTAEIGTAEHEKLFGLAIGATERVELAGGAFALLQAYATKPRGEGRWETHLAYIDVQAIYLGEEFMEVADRSLLTMHEDLTPGRDVIFYHPFSRGSALRCGPGSVAVYFPADAHMGALAIDAPMLVRKVVVKVPVVAGSAAR